MIIEKELIQVDSKASKDSDAKRINIGYMAILFS
jgi:hypothetical protein